MTHRIPQALAKKLKRAALIFAGWFLFWCIVVVGVAVEQEGLQWVLDRITGLPLAALAPAVLTSPLPAMAATVRTAAIEGGQELEKATGVGIAWRRFSLVFFGTPVVMLVVACDLDRSADAFGLLAQDNATLVGVL